MISSQYSGSIPASGTPAPLAELVCGSRAPSIDSTPACAKSLAALFRCTSVHPDGNALLLALHRRLLRETLVRAQRSTAHYGKACYAPAPDARPDAPLDLTCYPLLTRSEIIAEFDRFISDRCTFASACHTSGATGPSLTIYKSKEELDFIWNYYVAIQSAEPIEKKPLILSFPNMYHGVPVRMPSVGKVFVSGVNDDLLIKDALSVLTKRYQIDGCDDHISVITGLAYQVEFFTSYALQLGIDLTRLGVSALSIVGNYTSSHCRDFLQRSWHAHVYERFTLTESIAGAGRCHTCGKFHLDWHAIGEVVDVDTLEPIEEGVGHLVLTQLYPFVQMQPLVRYMTGDIVRRHRSTCANTLTFEFLGKAVNCIRSDDRPRDWLLFPADLYEAISGVPDVRLFENFPTVRSAHDRTVGSPPYYQISVAPLPSGTMAIELRIELRYAPARHAERAGQLSRQIRSDLLARNATLRERVEQGRLEVIVTPVGPGALGDVTRMKI